MNILYCLTDLSFLLINLSTHFCLLVYLCCVQFCVHDNQIGQYQCAYFPCASRENRCKTTFYHQTALKKKNHKKGLSLPWVFWKAAVFLTTQWTEQNQTRRWQRGEKRYHRTQNCPLDPVHSAEPEQLSGRSADTHRNRRLCIPACDWAAAQRSGLSPPLRASSSAPSGRLWDQSCSWCMHCTQPAHPQQRLMKCKFQQLKNNRQTGIANRIWKKNSPTAFHWHWPVRAV